MAQTTRQTNLLVQQDWTKIYQTFTNADFTSYDFETLRNSMITYLKTYYPETFNDFLESSEYIALIDMIAFLGQSLAFRADLNARENFIDTAQRRDSILKLARMLSYNPQRNTGATGFLKIDSVSTTEPLTDSDGINLSNAVVHWNDLTNSNWMEQFTNIINASLVSNQAIGKPGNSQSINNVKTDEYTISLNNNTLPIAGFSSTIQGSTVAFEAVSATSVGKSYIYEAPPTQIGAFNLLYRNDNNGNGSTNTGFFLYFKQGKLNATEFNITNAIPNNYVTVATNNINNNDQWLYSLDVNKNVSEPWEQVPALAGINVIYNQLTQKNLYQINTRTNDQVDLIFGDGAFSNIPQGAFRFYYRTSNGTTYSITPDDLATVSVAFSYISKKNRVETLTVTASLKYTVTNANAAPSLSSIKSAAPQQYYTQNRMITAEDYNIFPQTNFGSIQKIKAVNRTSSGVSLYLDALDPTGSFSSTNIFGDDGTISFDNTNGSKQFDFLTDNDIYSAVYNQIIPIINSTETRNHYYGNISLFPHYVANTTVVAAGNISFNQNTISTSTSSGFLANVVSNVTLQVGAETTSNLKYVDVGACLQFTAPSGYRFNNQHQLLAGNTLTNTGDTLSFFATVTDIVSNSSLATPNLVTFSTVVPTGAILSDVNMAGANAIIPSYKNDLSTGLISTIITQIKTLLNFGLRYNTSGRVVNSDGSLGSYGTWENILPSDIASATDWVLRFSYNSGLYTITYKSVKYVFASAGNTKFYFDPSARVYNSSIGTNVNDTIKLLKINNKPAPNATLALDNDVAWEIYDTITSPDGYVDKTSVLVRMPTQSEYVPANPDLYTTISSTSTISAGSFVSGVTYQIRTHGTTNFTAIGSTSNIAGTRFTANAIGSGTGNAQIVSRPGLYFQYKHNVPGRSRIDPTPVNIIDIYVLTSVYAIDYQNWLRDLTGMVVEPMLPTSTSLETSYNNLDQYKAVSDTIVFNPAKFKPLFGAKADVSLRARFQVVKNPAVNITDNEIKSQLIAAVNQYFSVSNWDFGETFYFSELAAYLHTTLAPNISSVLIVPASNNLVFGNYFQINSEPWEIITSAATVNDIDIISAVTAAQLNLGSTLIGTY